jgi:predicted peptidase
VAGVLLLLTGMGGCLKPEAEKIETMPQQIPTGFLARTVEWGGQTYRYMVYVPADYTGAQAWPAILFLHGAGERGQDGVRQAEVGIGKALREHPEWYPAIVVMPQCLSGMRWEGPMLDMAVAALEQVEKTYHVDPDRVVLTGLSLGGHGTWGLGSQRPGRFAALGPICGWGMPSQAEALARTPIWCWHGAADPVVPVSASREMVEAIEAAGGQIRYAELPGVGHNSWDAAYGTMEFAEFLTQSRRK